MFVEPNSLSKQLPKARTTPRGRNLVGSPWHEPVLLEEAVSALNPRDGGRYLDGTFGGGGHARAILERSAPSGRVLALDLDREAVKRGLDLVAEPGIGERLVVSHNSFSVLAEIAVSAQFAPLDGILLDLGLSSFQIDDASRGFAFRLDGPLDMRFNQAVGKTAADLVNELTEQELAGYLWRYGEERNSRKIAAAIVAERGKGPIRSTSQLVDIIQRVSGSGRSSIHPATRTFQALRIATNQELLTLATALESALAVLAPGGRLAVISFHSLEDRIVKQFIARESAGCICPPEQPVCTCNHQPRLKAAGKAIRPRETETQRNPRSRSATLRVVERLHEAVAIA